MRFCDGIWLKVKVLGKVIERVKIAGMKGCTLSEEAKTKIFDREC